MKNNEQWKDFTHHFPNPARPIMRKSAQTSAFNRGVDADIMPQDYLG
jgi:hypothetical protein